MAQDYTLNVKVKGFDKVKTEVDGLTKSMEEAGDSSTYAFQKLDGMLGGMPSKLRGGIAGIKGMTTGMKTLRGAIISTGIGALVVAVGSLVAYMTRTKRGADELRIATAVLGGVMDYLMDTVISLGEFIFNAFNNPRETIKSLRDDIQNFVIDKVNQLMDGLGLLGEAIKQAFSGDFSGAMETAGEGLRKVADSALALHPLTAVTYQYATAVAQIAVEATASAKAAGVLENRMNAVRDAQRGLTVQRSQDRAEIKRLNMTAEDTTKSLEEREAAAQRALEIEMGLMAERRRIAKEELDIARAQVQLSESTEEDLQNMAELEAAYIDIQTESFEMQTTLNNKLNTIRKEAAAATQAAADAIIEAEEEVTKALQEAALSREDAQTQERAKVTAHYEELGIKAGENADLQAQIKEAERVALQEIDDKYDALELAATNEKNAKQKAIDDAAADKRKKDAKAAAEAEMALKEEVATSTFSILTNLNEAFSKKGEEQSKKAFERSKAMSIAETLVSTYLTAQKAYQSQFVPLADVSSPVRGALAAAVAVAGGLAKVAAIKSTQFNSAGGGGGGGGGGFSGGGTASVGVDVGSLIPNQQTPTPEPVRAYVVENEISNKQALNRELQIQTTL
jgi:hypothetical protein